MSKVLIIDDSDPAITYTGSWTTSSSVGGSREYNATVHQSGSAGDELKYTFYGTGISVYGTLERPAINGDPKATFSIDGEPLDTLNSSTLMWVESESDITPYVLFYQSPPLIKGTHTLTIRSDSGGPARLYIDFLTVATGLESVTGNVIVDDRDSSITYAGSWNNREGAWEYGRTARLAPIDQIHGSATFRFFGTSITMYGTAHESGGPGTNALVDFTLDGNFAATFTAPQNSSKVQKHMAIFHAEGLPYRDHVVVAESLTLNQWALDCIVYKEGNSTVAQIGGSDSQAPQVGGGTNLGPIIGGVVAAVVGILAIAAIAFLCVRRRKVQQKAELLKESRDTEVHQDARYVGAAITPMPPNDPFPIPNNTQAYLLPNKQYDSNTNVAALMGVPPDRNGWQQPNGAPSMSTGEGSTSSSQISDPPVMSQYSDGESAMPLTPSVASHAYGGVYFSDQPLSNQLYPRFFPGAGAYTSRAWQNNERPQAEKVLYVPGSGPPAPLQAFATRRLPGSSVRSREEDSGIRLPVANPPLYTPD